MSEKNKAVVRRYVEEMCSQGKLEVADEIFHPRARNPRNTAMWSNAPEIVKEFIAANRKSFPDMRREICDMVAEGSKVVLYSTYKGTYTGAGGALGYLPTNTPLEMTGVATFVVENGKMVDEPWNCGSMNDIQYPLAKAVVRYWIEEVYDKGNFDRIEEVVAPDYKLHDPAMPDVSGIDGVQEMIASTRKILPDLHDIIEDLLADGDRVIARWTASGTHRGEFMGIAPTGRPVTIAGTSIYRFQDGRIAEEWKI